MRQGMIPTTSTFEAIKERISVAEVLERYGHPLGHNGKTLCPFHSERTPSFGPLRDNPQKFKCLSAACGKSGDVFDLVEHFASTNRKGAIRLLQEWANVPQAEPRQKVRPRVRVTPPPIPPHEVESRVARLWNNAQALDFLRTKRGFSDDTIRAYKLGLDQNSGRISFPIYDAGGKCVNLRLYGWTEQQRRKAKWWNHVVWEGEPGRSARKHEYGGNFLYPIEALQESDLLLCEGEPDCLLARQMGFHAITAACGAGAWPAEFSRMFTGKVVTICYDQDPPDANGRRPGLIASESIAGKLHAAGARVKIINLPVNATKQDKDFTDWVRNHGGTAEQLRQMIANAPWYSPPSPPEPPTKGNAFADKTQAEDTRILPEGHSEPYGFEVAEHGIERVTQTDKGERKQQVFPTPMYVEEILRDVDDDTETLSVRYRKGHAWRAITGERAAFSDQRRIVAFANYGAPFNTSNGRGAVEYLSAYLIANEHVIPVRRSFSTCGWKQVDGKPLFAAGQKVIGEGADALRVHVASTGEAQILRAVGVDGGSLNEWLDAVRDLQECPIALFTVFAAFVPPLLKTLGIYNFGVHLSGETSTGKSTSLMLAAAAWGNPAADAGYWATWQTTPVALERRGQTLCDLPMFLDESSTVDERKAEEMLYLLANGTGKARGSRGGLQTMGGWRTVAISTGEGSVADLARRSGASARVLLLHGAPLGTGKGAGELANRVRDVALNNYGHAGPHYIEFLLSPDKGFDATGLRETHRVLERHYAGFAKTAAGGSIGRLTSACAAVELAGMVLCHIFDLPISPRSVVESAFQLAANELATQNKAQEAFELVKSWVASRKGQMWEKEDYDTSADPPGGWIGRIKKDEWVALFQDPLSNLLKNRGYDLRHIARLWRDKGWLMPDATGKLTKSIRFNGDNPRMYVIPWDAWTHDD